MKYQVKKEQQPKQPVAVLPVHPVETYTENASWSGTSDSDVHAIIQVMCPVIVRGVKPQCCTFCA